MITTQRPLKIRDILGVCHHDYDGKIWGNEDFLTSKSWVSLCVIVQLYSQIFNSKPTFLFPEYYCDDTLSSLRDIANIEYYKLDEKLNIDIDKIKKQIKDRNCYDFLVAVHFFGKEYDFNDIKAFCKSNNVILIEDAVHVAIPNGKIGKYGDFTLYSPWKIYGLYDGAILNINSDTIFELSKEEICKRIKHIMSEFDVHSSIKVNSWKIKKIIQKIIPNVKRGTLGVKIRQNANENKRKSKHYIPKVSKFSSRIISGIKQADMENLMERKHELAMSIEHYVQRKYGVKSFYDETFMNSLPYAIVLSIDDYYVKQKIVDDINKIGCIAYEWPNLPIDLPKDTNAFDIKRKLLFITVHDGIKLESLSKHFCYSDYYKIDTNKNLEIKLIDEETYGCFSTKIMIPILQSIVYGKAKKDVQGWKRKLYMISINGKTIAVFTVLSKYGFIHRINHGPVFSNEIDNEDRIMLIKAIKKTFSGITKGVLFFAPNLCRIGYNINSMLAMGFKYRNEYFSTGFIDLNKTEEELRKQLSSKWRNCLKNAEKRGLIVQQIKSKEEFYQMLKLHKTDKENRSYSDSGDNITEYLFDHSSLLGLYVKNDIGEIISFVFISLHGETATYYIGWSNDEGYKSNASRLLLWHSIIILKEKSCHWFDVGGIDFINTKGVAEFKSGTGCAIYEYVGEFVAY